MKATLEKYGPLGARFLLALIFIISGFAKISNPAATGHYIASKGLPIPELLGGFASVLELAGGLVIVLGLRARAAALILAAYLVPVTIIFHDPAGLHGMAAQMAMTQLLKNLGIIGGLVLLGIHGSGPLSLDSVIGKKRKGA